MRKLSIIIPVLGRLEQQESTLVSVLQNRPADAEVLVVSNRRYDDPYDLAGEVRFLQARRRAAFIECLNLALRESQAPIVHLLTCGIETADDWAASALRHFRDPQVAAVTPLILSAAEPQRIVAAGAGFSRGGAIRLLGQRRAEASLGPWVSQMTGPSFLAGFYRKAALEAAGGFDSSLGYAAVVDLALRLRAQGHRLLLDPQSKMYVADEVPSMPQGFRAGLHAERLFLRHVPEGRWLSALTAHAFVAAAEFFRAAPRPYCISSLMGRAVAWAGFSRQREICRLGKSLEPAAEASIPLTTSAVPRPHIGLAKRRITRDAA